MAMNHLDDAEFLSVLFDFNSVEAVECCLVVRTHVESRHLLITQDGTSGKHSIHPQLGTVALEVSCLSTFPALVIPLAGKL